jgi:nucleoside-diphosphate-sugar epimerase
MSFWRDKTVLVTGPAGFAGSHLAEHLSRLGANVRCFIREGETLPITAARMTTVIGDIQDYQSLLQAFEHVDVAFHLAAITLIPEARTDVFKTFNVNTLGTLNFLMAGKEKNAGKLVYVSTCQVYGKQTRFPLSERDLPHPIDIYSASKLAGEDLAISFSETEKVNVSISRAFNHYGPRQRHDFLIPGVIDRLLHGKELELHNPRSTRDFSYVDDIVRGYALLAEKGRSGEVYHFCSGIERSIEDVVHTIAKVGQFNAKINRSSKPNVEVSRSVGNYSKAKKELGWEPSIGFEEGIRKTLAWYRTNLTGAKSYSP